MKKVEITKSYENELLLKPLLTTKKEIMKDLRQTKRHLIDCIIMGYNPKKKVSYSQIKKIAKQMLAEVFAA